MRSHLVHCIAKANPGVGVGNAQRAACARMPESVRVWTIPRRWMAQTIAESEPRRQSVHHRVGSIGLFLVAALNLSRAHHPHAIELAAARQRAIKAGNRASIGMSISRGNFRRAPRPGINGADSKGTGWIVD